MASSGDGTYGVPIPAYDHNQQNVLFELVGRCWGEILFEYRQLLPRHLGMQYPNAHKLEVDVFHSELQYHQARYPPPE